MLTVHARNNKLSTEREMRRCTRHEKIGHAKGKWMPSLELGLVFNHVTIYGHDNVVTFKVSIYSNSHSISHSRFVSNSQSVQSPNIFRISDLFQSPSLLEHEEISSSYYLFIFNFFYKLAD